MARGSSCRRARNSRGRRRSVLGSTPGWPEHRRTVVVAERSGQVRGVRELRRDERRLRALRQLRQDDPEHRQLLLSAAREGGGSGGGGGGGSGAPSRRPAARPARRPAAVEGRRHRHRHRQEDLLRRQRVDGRRRTPAAARRREAHPGSAGGGVGGATQARPTAQTSGGNR